MHQPMAQHNLPDGSDSGRLPSDDHSTDELSDDAGEEESTFSRWTLPSILLILTIFTTLWAGAFQAYPRKLAGPVRMLIEAPEWLWLGIPFAVTLIGILVTHELGHFVVSRMHGVPASLPLFIPGFPQMIGTFGAIIRVKGPIQDRRALFDIGVAGPLAGFVAAIIALTLGLLSSHTQDTEGQFGVHYGEPLIFKLMTFVIFGPLPIHTEVVPGPIAFAAWFGIFVTSLNLIPIGQLDGGHVAYALWGSRQQTIVFAVLIFVIVLGFVGWTGWFLWAFLAMMLGFGHPPVVNPNVPLGRWRVLVSWIALAVFLLSFTPVPFSLP